MSYITRVVFLHVAFKRAQMLLIFSSYQTVYNVSYVVPCTEVTYKWYFVIQ